MQMITVASTNISSIGYENGTLYVAFHSGGLYAYFDVPANVYQGLMNSLSKGSYFAQYIKRSYPYRRIG